MHTDQEFLEYVVKSLVDNPNDVSVDRKVDEMGVLITLSVHSDDMGKIIGRQGNTAKAIRTLLRVIGMKNNSRVNLKINEPEGSERPSRRPETEDKAPVADTSAPAQTEAPAPTPTPTPTAAAEVDAAMADLENI